MSATKSAGVVGKWGSASFTSLRHSNGEKPGWERQGSLAKPKPKKFFKSRGAPVVDEDEDDEEVEEFYESKDKGLFIEF